MNAPGAQVCGAGAALQCPPAGKCIYCIPSWAGTHGTSHSQLSSPSNFPFPPSLAHPQCHSGADLQASAAAASSFVPASAKGYLGCAHCAALGVVWLAWCC